MLNDFRMGDLWPNIADQARRDEDVQDGTEV
jgi:hypothetical protein